MARIPTRTLTGDELQRVAARVKTTEKLDAIARSFGVSKNTLVRWLERSGYRVGRCLQPIVPVDMGEGDAK